MQICPNDLLLSSRSLNDEYGVPEPACVSKYTSPSMFDVLHLEVSSNCSTTAGRLANLPIANPFKSKDEPTYAQKSLNNEVGVPEPACASKCIAPSIFDALDLEVTAAHKSKYF